MIVRNASGGGGVKLPVLTNPADAEKIIAGYEAVDGEGNPIAGSLGAGITNPAGADQIFSGYEAIGKSGDLLKGIAGADITSPATAAKIALGFQALDKTGNLLTGTGTLATYAVKTGTITAKSSGSITAPGEILLVLCEGSDYAGGTTPNAGKQILTHYYTSSGTTAARKCIMSVSGNTFTYDGSGYGSSSPTTLTYYIVYKV